MFGQPLPDCASRVYAPGGRTAAQPCAGPVCLPHDVVAWELVARQWVDAAAQATANGPHAWRIPSLREQLHTAPLRLVPGAIVDAYLSTAQQASCIMQAARSSAPSPPLPAPAPTPAQPSRPTPADNGHGLDWRPFPWPYLPLPPEAAAAAAAELKRRREAGGGWLDQLLGYGGLALGGLLLLWLLTQEEKERRR